MKRRSFLLLEVLIAVILIGSFAYASIHGAFQTLAKERKILKEFKDAMEVDKRRMQIIADYWASVDTIHKTMLLDDGYKVSRQDANDGKHYLLNIKDPGNGKSFYYLVIRPLS